MRNDNKLISKGKPVGPLLTGIVLNLTWYHQKHGREHKTSLYGRHVRRKKKKDLENLTLGWPKDSYTHHNMNHNAYRQSGKIHPNGLAG